MYFLGESDHTMDAKGRVFIPKRFHELFDRDPKGNLRAVLLRGFDKCLFVYSTQGFESVMKRLKVRDFRGGKLRTMQRKFLTQVNPVSLDGSGRLLIPEKLKLHAGLSRDVSILGVGERAEIWDAERWREYDAATEDSYDEMDDILCGSADPDEGGEPDFPGFPSPAEG